MIYPLADLCGNRYIKQYIFKNLCSFKDYQFYNFPVDTIVLALKSNIYNMNQFYMIMLLNQAIFYKLKFIYTHLYCKLSDRFKCGLKVKSYLRDSNIIITLELYYTDYRDIFLCNSTRL